MKLLNRNLLASLDITFLDEATYQSLADHFEQTLEERVINEIIQELTPEQAQQLATFQEKSDDELYAWLMENVPTLSDIVSDEIDILLGEIAENAEQFA